MVFNIVDMPAKEILVPATFRKPSDFVDDIAVKTEDELNSLFIVESDFFGVDSFHIFEIKVSNVLFRKTQILV